MKNSKKEHFTRITINQGNASTIQVTEFIEEKAQMQDCIKYKKKTTQHKAVMWVCICSVGVE